MTGHNDTATLDLRKKLAQIDHALMHHDRKPQVHENISYADALWLAVSMGMGIGAALFAAGAAFLKLLGW